MAGTISFFVIGIFILESVMCWSIGDPRDIKARNEGLNPDISPCIYFAEPYTLVDVIDWLEFFDLLNVHTIWLGSIFSREDYEATSNHSDVHSELGSMADFERLVDSAHKHDIRVIIPISPFETHVTHPWFKKWRDNVSPFNDFYLTVAGEVELDDDYDDEEARVYELALDQKGWSEERHTLYLVNHMNSPCLDVSNPEVRSQLNKEIIEFWLNKGVDGFVIQRFAHHVLHSGWLPPGREHVTANNNDYLHEIRKFVDDWAIKNNSSSKFLGAVTDKFVNTSVYDSYTGGHPLNFIYKIHTFPDFYNAAYLKRYMESTVDLFSREEDAHQLIWSVESTGPRVLTRKFISIYFLAMLMPGKVRLHLSLRFLRGRLVDWDSEVAHHLTTLRQRSVFKYGDWKVEALNDDAVFVLRRELSDDPAVYLVVLNTGMEQETVNLASVFSDLKDQLHIVLTSRLKDARRAERVMHRDSVTLSAEAAIVLIAYRRDGDETIEHAGC